MAIGEVICGTCGVKFIGTARAKYCGNTCRQWAFQEKKRQEKRKLKEQK